jgi:hypothetical protein
MGWRLWNVPVRPRLLNSSREIASQITDEISSCENNRHVDNSRFENFISCRCRPTELGSQSCPGGPYQEPCERDNGADVQYLIKKKNRSGICQSYSTHQSLLCAVNPQMYGYRGTPPSKTKMR